MNAINPGPRKTSPSTGDASAEEVKDALVPARPDLSQRDYVTQLLSIGAHVEHALMVQYLYAAYSLRAEDPNDRKHVERVERWRSTLLTVAREEMGHLLTVQNILTLLGAPTDFGRDTSVWASPFYPFRFSLLPFSRKALVRFIFAEMPSEKTLTGSDEPADKPLKAEEMAKFATGHEPGLIETLIKDINDYDLRKQGHRVGPTYGGIIKILSNSTLVPDSCFDEGSYERQASFDEWGRNYRQEPHQLDAEGNLKKTPSHPLQDAIVYVRRVATRTDAIEALRELSEQGEAPDLNAPEGKELSHFARFVEIYRDLLELEKERGVQAATGGGQVIENPTTRKFLAERQEPAGSQDPAEAARPADPFATKYTYIEAGRAHFLAQVFNQRYRLLLNFLAHTFRIARPTRFDRPNLRSMLMHRAFAEMYNLKTLASLLTNLPASENKGETRLAAPPFEMPPTLALPMRETDVWRGHRDLIATSRETMGKFLDPATNSPNDYKLSDIEGFPTEAFVKTLMQIDAQTLQWIDQILVGSASRESNF